MNTKENRKRFLEHYFAICTEHGFFIDAVRDSCDLRLHSFSSSNDSEREWFEMTQDCLLEDAGL